MVICYYAGKSVMHLLKQDIPAHTLFGASKLDQHGLQVVYHEQGPLPLTRKSRLWRSVVNAWLLMAKFRTFDILYATTFTGLELLVLLRSLGIFRRPIVVLAYTEAKAGRGFSRMLFRHFYKGVDKLLLSSPLNYSKAVQTGHFQPGQLLQINPGPDADYYGRLSAALGPRISAGGFISTGREERDFETLLKAFAGRKEKLTIYVSPKHGTRDYARYFDEHRHLIGSNVTVHVLEKPLTAEQVARETLRHAWIVCCAYPTNYNTGYTSLQEAAGLGMPIISTRNPYYGIDINKEGIGFTFDYTDVTALRTVLDHIASGPASTASEMGNRARHLAESRWNVNIFVTELAKTFRSL